MKSAFHPDPLGAFLRRLEQMPPRSHYDAVFNEACELHADWRRPDQNSRRPANHNVEILMHAVAGVGPTDEAAARDWITTAKTSRPDLFGADDGRMICPFSGQAVA